MGKTVVFTGGKAGPADSSRHWLEGAGLIIAADSGLDLSRSWGYEPDLLCGDFDSISDTAAVRQFPADKVIRHQEAKAWSDTELALHEGRKRTAATGKGITVLVGGNGGRADHLFSLLKLYSHDTYPDIWLGDEQAILCLEGAHNGYRSLQVTGLEKDDKISCFAIRVEGGESGGNTNAWEGAGYRATLEKEPAGTTRKSGSIPLSEYAITSDTLLWPLQDVQWETGAESLSNWLKSGADTLQLTVQSGRFLVFVPLHAQVQYQVV
ncbi:MAG: hypothetical protein MJ178_00005 [Treponemataceae bacterium]|nr:hypothetical protein [Treponemataceae bacterium]